MRMVLDMPLPQQIDCRPWQCKTCKPQMQWSVNFSDIRKVCPHVLQTQFQKHLRRRYFTKHFLVHAVEVLTESLNLKACRRSFINYYVANSMSILGGAYGLRYVANTMKRRELQNMLCLALEAYLPKVVKLMSESIHVYSGSAVKHDGNYEIASRVMVPGL